MTQTYDVTPHDATVHPGDARYDLDRVPGPDPMPVVGAYGNIARFFYDTIPYIDTLAHGGYGNVVSFARGMRRGLLWPEEKSSGAVFVFGNHLTHQILVKRADASFAETVVAAFPDNWQDAARLNGGLLWLSREPHRQRRKLVTPLYHQRSIQKWSEQLVCAIERRISRFTPGESIDVMKMTGDVLVDFQNTVVMGIDGYPPRLAETGQRMVELLDVMRSPLAHFAPPIPYTPRGKTKAYAADVSHRMAEIIARKRAQDGDATDVLTMLIRGECEDGSKLTDNEVMAETYGLFLGGWFSTRASMAWTMLMLAQHPEVAEALYEEASSALQGGAPTAEKLKQMPVLDGVVKESHRLFPPIPVITRVATEPVEIEGYRLPPRTEIYISIYHTHRQAEVFPQPNRYLPERWRSIDPGPYEYLPFGIGSRVCPGNALAMMQMKYMLAMMIQRYRFEAIASRKVDCFAVGIVTPKPDLRMIVRKQDRQFARSRVPLRGSVNTLVDLT